MAIECKELLCKTLKIHLIHERFEKIGYTQTQTTNNDSTLTAPCFCVCTKLKVSLESAFQHFPFIHSFILHFAWSQRPIKTKNTKCILRFCKWQTSAKLMLWHHPDAPVSLIAVSGLSWAGHRAPAPAVPWPRSRSQTSVSLSLQLRNMERDAGNVYTESMNVIFIYIRIYILCQWKSWCQFPYLLI